MRASVLHIMLREAYTSHDFVGYNYECKYGDGHFDVVLKALVYLMFFLLLVLAEIEACNMVILRFAPPV
jgi:hypothetical protein